jgi:periplasmic divalent cation tolerance protein
LESTDMIQVTTTIDSQHAAEVLSRTLVERSLAACVQVIGPVTSTYRWEGDIEVAQEWLCLAKLSRAAYPELEKAILDLHSYDVPEILATPITAGADAYLSWVRENTTS